MSCGHCAERSPVFRFRGVAGAESDRQFSARCMEGESLGIQKNVWTMLGSLHSCAVCKPSLLAKHRKAGFCKDGQLPPSVASPWLLAKHDAFCVPSKPWDKMLVFSS